MKALILGGGRGKRLEELSEETAKCMLVIRDKPLIEYSLDCAVATDVSEIVILVGYRAEEIINRYGNSYQGKRIKYVIQREQRGVVHALECVIDAIQGEDFMLLLGDELMINPKHPQMMKAYIDESLFGVCGVIPVGDINLIKKTYSIIQGDNHRIFRLIEKPTRPMNNFMGTGNCIFKNEIFSYIEQTPINQKRGEKELVDLIQCAIDEGHAIKSFIICDKYFNINFKDEMQEAVSYFAHF